MDCSVGGAFVDAGVVSSPKVATGWLKSRMLTNRAGIRYFILHPLVEVKLYFIGEILGIYLFHYYGLLEPSNYRGGILTFPDEWLTMSLPL
jgi:hypothetical protein